ncbi:hypothetical protein BC939DRAFT_320708 [Gamsiella multidivaricata]|uniref:uncharacterized protein n=1 Tax=Gamsiella multidivaricata TaxID=101098 RepID=UPI0022205F53|nr:uncharacterized protein BC939DRAFT_320708 [Gamsiella multidivaricata]KAI7829757.1 hypothetical protein BC939DRAFT_320708 [Gamsiella multidivaricata]
MYKRNEQASTVYLQVMVIVWGLDVRISTGRALEWRLLRLLIAGRELLHIRKRTAVWGRIHLGHLALSLVRTHIPVGVQALGVGILRSNGVGFSLRSDAVELVLGHMVGFHTLGLSHVGVALDRIRERCARGRGACGVRVVVVVVVVVAVHFWSLGEGPFACLVEVSERNGVLEGKERRRERVLTENERR